MTRHESLGVNPQPSGLRWVVDPNNRRWVLWRSSGKWSELGSVVEVWGSWRAGRKWHKALRYLGREARCTLADCSRALVAEVTK